MAALKSVSTSNPGDIEARCAATGMRMTEQKTDKCLNACLHALGALRRMYVRGSDNVFKRVLVQAAAFNIGLLLRKLSGWGKPRQAQGRLNQLQSLLFAVFALSGVCRAISDWLGQFGSQLFPQINTRPVGE